MTSAKFVIDSLPLQAYKHLDMAVFIKNLKGHYLWANQFFINKSAGLCSLHDIYNKKDHHFPWHEYASELLTNDEKLVDQRNPISAYETITRHDGTAIRIVSKKSPLYDKHMQLVGLLGISVELPNPLLCGRLTPREYEVGRLLCEGLTDKQAAKVLAVSPRTIEAHINNVKQKLNIKSRAKLISTLCRSYP